MINTNKKNKIRERNGVWKKVGDKDSISEGVSQEGLSGDSFEWRLGGGERGNHGDFLGAVEGIPSRGNIKGEYMIFCLNRCSNYLLVPLGFL